MRTKKIFQRPLLLLLLLCLSLGLYKAATLGSISNDSVIFLEIADQLKTSPTDAIKSNYQHPGFPAAILLVEKSIEWLTGSMSLHQKIMAGQIVNLFCRTITLGFLFYIFLHFGSRKTAFIGTLFVLLIPAYADNGSDVLSDWPNLMFMSVAFLSCLRGLSKAHPGWFLLAGVAAGWAYWIRPEGLFLLIVTGIYFCIHIFHAPNKLRCLACLLTMTISTCLITGPYMYYKGAIFPKKNVGTFSQQITPVTTIPDDNCGITPYRAQPFSLEDVKQCGYAVIHFLDKTFNTIYLIIVPLFAAIIWKLLSFNRLRRQERFLAIFIVLWLLMMIWLYSRTGYMSHRHIMPLLVFSFAWIQKGILLLALFFWKQRYHLHRKVSILLVICAVIFIPKLIRPVRVEKSVYKRAGVWLSQNTPDAACLTVFDNRIGFYAQRKYRRLKQHRKIIGNYLIIKSRNKSIGIPDDAVQIKTEKGEIDEVISIYELRSHQE